MAVAKPHTTRIAHGHDRPPPRQAGVCGGDGRSVVVSFVPLRPTDLEKKHLRLRSLPFFRAPTPSRKKERQHQALSFPRSPLRSLGLPAPPPGGRRPASKRRTTPVAFLIDFY